MGALLALLFGDGASAQTFSASSSIAPHALIDFEADTAPQLTADGLGNWVAVWQSFHDLNGTLGPDWDILITRSANAGATWSIPEPLNTNADTDSGGDGDPQIATDGAGTWIAVWGSTDTLGGTVGSDSDVLVSRSTNLGVTWSPPVPLNTNAASDSGTDIDPQVVTNGVGDWVAIWTSSEDLGTSVGPDFDIFASHSSNGGVTWSAPVVLNTNAGIDAGSDQFAALATDAAGNWVAVWQSHDDLGSTIGTDADILSASSTNAGATWSAPVPVNTNAATDVGFDRYPRVATDGFSNWVTVWESQDDLGGTIGTDADILVARSANFGATWTPPAPLDTGAATDLASDVLPQIATDFGGLWLAIWVSTNDLNGTIGGDHDAVIARSCDVGATWTAPVPLFADAATDSAVDTEAQLATDGAGNWAALAAASDQVGSALGPDYDILGATAKRNVGCTQCPVTPVFPGTCPPADNGVITIADLETAKPGKITFKLTRAAATTQTDFGDPTEASEHAICLYRQTAPELVTELLVGPDALKWQPLSDKGWRYKDRFGGNDGVRRLVVKGSDKPRTKLIVKAKGEHLPGLASGALPFASGDFPLTVQIFSEDSGACWEATCEEVDVRQNTSERFKCR